MSVKSVFVCKGRDCVGRRKRQTRRRLTRNIAFISLPKPQLKVQFDFSTFVHMRLWICVTGPSGFTHLLSYLSGSLFLGKASPASRGYP